jgi:hypothetical protein
VVAPDAALRNHKRYILMELWAAHKALEDAKKKVELARFLRSLKVIRKAAYVGSNPVTGMPQASLIEITEDMLRLVSILMPPTP